MFKINMHKIYLSLITIILLTGQAQATRIFSFLCCNSNKKQVIPDILKREVIPARQMSQNLPQVAPNILKQEIIPAQQMSQNLLINEKVKLTLPELFIAPTQETIELLDKIQQQDANKVLKFSAKQFALQKLVIELHKFDRQIDRPIASQMFKNYGEYNKAISHGRQALANFDKLMSKYYQMMGEEPQQQVPQQVQQQVQQQLTEQQLTLKANDLLGCICNLYAKYRDTADDAVINQDGFYQQNFNRAELSIADLKQLNKTLDDLTRVFATAKQQNCIFSTRTLLDFAVKLERLIYFNRDYDSQKFATLYAAIVQNIQPYYSDERAQNLVMYNNRTQDSAKIIKLILAAQQDPFHQEHEILLYHLCTQIKTGLVQFLAYDPNDANQAQLDKKEIQMSIVGFQILGELARKTDGIWVSSDTSEFSSLVLNKICNVLSELIDPKLLTNKAYVVALVSALEHITATATLERQFSCDCVFAKIVNQLSYIIYTIEKQKVQPLLLPTLLPKMLRIYTHINAKMYFKYGNSQSGDTLNRASEDMLKLVKQIDSNQLSAIKEAMHCMVVMSNNMFRYQTDISSSIMCSILEHLVQINPMTHATALQILKVYELANAPSDNNALFYNSRINSTLMVLQAIGEKSTEGIILKDAICMLRRINIFSYSNNSKKILEVLFTFSKKYHDLYTQNSKNSRSFVEKIDWVCEDCIIKSARIEEFENKLFSKHNDAPLQQIFGAGQKLLKKPEQRSQKYCALIYVSQFLDISDIDPCCIVETEQYTQFLTQQSASEVLDYCTQQLQVQQNNFAEEIPEQYKCQFQFETM